MPGAISHLAKPTPCTLPDWPGSAAQGCVLVVGDDPGTRATALRYLAGRHVPAAGATSYDMARRLDRDPVSLVVLDLRAVPGDGVQVLRRIRARSEVPVILVAGQQCTDLDRIVSLELGAEDVLSPLNLRELLARMRATLRRQEAGRRAVPPGVRGGYRFAGWVLDGRSRALRDPAGRTVELTRTGYALLVALLEAPRRPLARAQIMRATRAHEDIHDRTIDAQVLRLRRKIEADPAAPKLIRTGRGRGYMLDASVETIP